jgi:hypothetical protein
MREIRSSGSVEGVVLNHDSYSDFTALVRVFLCDADFHSIKKRFPCEGNGIGN